MKCVKGIIFHTVTDKYIFPFTKANTQSNPSMQTWIEE